VVSGNFFENFTDKANNTIMACRPVSDCKMSLNDPEWLFRVKLGFRASSLCRSVLIRMVVSAPSEPSVLACYVICSAFILCACFMCLFVKCQCLKELNAMQMEPKTFTIERAA